VAKNRSITTKWAIDNRPFCFTQSHQNMIKHFLAHIKQRVGRRQSLFCHPLWQAVIFFCETCAAIEFTLHLDRFISPSL